MQRISNVSHLSLYMLDRNKLPIRKKNWEKFEKDTLTNSVNLIYPRKGNNIVLEFQNITQLVEKKLLF